MEQIYCNYYNKKLGQQNCYFPDQQLSYINSNSTSITSGGYNPHCSYCKYNQTRIDKDNRHKEIDSLKKQAMLGFKIK